ncbi:MAG: AAA family ATPase [Candidatus Pacebacteria bacterium]|nr:AAA family ATPase [Candidatus Paceibacterota bacterium]
MSQDEALDILKMGHSIFLTGAAGTGKTFVLNKYIEYLKTHSITPIITASTGIAATHIAGQTIHSWSGIGILDKIDKFTLDRLEQNEKLYKKYENIKVLIIDEISMLHASKLDMINTLFKTFRKNSKAFAGIQIIFCGDFFQLPPVVKNYQNKNLESLEKENEKEFAYNSNAWKELNPVICYLSKNYRQEDEKLLKILNNIRFETDQEEVLRDLEEKTKEYKEEKDILRLYTHNIDVDSINKDQYQNLTEKNEHIYEMSSHGKKNIIENLKNTCLAQESIKLKIGTKVIFVKNDQNKNYQNGTLGIVIDFDNNDMPIVETFNKNKILVKEESWQYTDDNGKVLGEISQIPLRYAWAITIHKSQGMTLDAAEIDLGRAFGSGMGYVALSRVKEFKNINLISVGKEALKINNNVLKQDKLFQEKSERAVLAIKKYYEDKEMKKNLIKKQEDFIINCEGSIIEVEIQEENFFEETKPKIKTAFITLESIKENITPKHIAEKRNLTLGTIVSHIEELFEARVINQKDIEYIIKDIEKHYSSSDMKIIKKILKQDTGLKVKHEELNKKYKIEIDFNELKLLRLNI